MRGRTICTMILVLAVSWLQIMYYSIQTSGIRFNAMQKTLKEEVETAVKQAKDQIDLNKAAAKTSNEAYQQNTLAQPDDAFTSTTPPVKVAERHGGVLDTSARVREVWLRGLGES